jgi:hypothetical protein
MIGLKFIKSSLLFTFSEKYFFPFFHISFSENNTLLPLDMFSSIIDHHHTVIHFLNKSLSIFILLSSPILTQ